jgi:DNA-binding HxlR family transcriptional regulator
MAQRKKASTNSMNRKMLNDFCGMVYAIDILGGRWKLLILYKLENKTLRFKDLKKIIPNITERMLTLQLRELEKNQLVQRAVYAEVPPRVEYTLTDSGKMLIPIWKKLELWGLAHRAKVESPAREAQDRNGRAVESQITDQEEIIV